MRKVPVFSSWTALRAQSGYVLQTNARSHAIYRLQSTGNPWRSGHRCHHLHNRNNGLAHLYRKLDLGRSFKSLSQIRIEGATEFQTVPLPHGDPACRCFQVDVDRVSGVGLFNGDAAAIAIHAAQIACRKAGTDIGLTLP